MNTEHHKHFLPSVLRVAPLILVFLHGTICLRSELVASDYDVRNEYQEMPIVDLRLPSSHLVSRYQDASINGHAVKLEHFGYSEPRNGQLYSADNSDTIGKGQADPVQTIVVANASFSHLYSGEVNAKTQFMFVFNYTEAGKVTATRVRLFSSNADHVYPVTCVARQQEGILSWQLPLDMGDSYSYWWSSRTLCPVDKNHRQHLEKNQLIYVTVASMSTEKKDFNLTTIKIDDFEVEHDVPKTFSVAVARPKYYMYYFPDGIDHVLVRVTSSSDVCMTVSVQKIKCPVFDLETNVEFDGIYQTMSTQTTMLLQRADFPGTNGFYIVFITKADNKDCTGYLEAREIQPGGQTQERRKDVNIIITDTISTTQYWKATSAAFGFFTAFYLLAFVIFCFCRGCGLPKSLAEMSPEDFEVARSLMEQSKRVRFNIHGDNSTDTDYSSNDYCERFVHRSPSPTAYGAMERGQRGLDEERSIRREMSTVSTSSAMIDEAAIDFLSDADYEKDVFRTKTALFVSDLSRKKRTKLAKIYKTFYWNLLTIAIFYGLPVVQLVINYQKKLNESGDQDLCYYNFGCAHPFMNWLSAFNNVYSNIGYIMLGLLFILIVRVRDRQAQKTSKEFGDLAERYGIPQHFGLFYAMGIALCMEGIMSASYHVCPSYQNFQFDTSFMYIIACLVMLKIYQCRHPDINAKAHVAYFSMALIIFIAVMGVVYGNNVFWILYALVHMLGTLVLTAQIYYMGRWSIDRHIFKRMFLVIMSDFRHCSMPIYPHRFWLLVVGNIVNWGFAIFGAVTQPNNFASFFLGIFIGNLLLYTIFYLIMKLWSRERLSWLVILVILASLVTWGGSLHFFFDQLSNWQRTPAGSREQNRECMLMKFYDSHDVWHFLSALSMFFSFLIIFLLDDDLAQTRRDKIPVF